MPFARDPRPDHLASVADASRTPFWLDQPGRPDPAPALVGATSCDLLVIGGGFTGLWTALLAKTIEPARNVVLLEAHEVASAATGRNGGFVASSLTHGFANGHARWPGELAVLTAMGHANLDAIESTVAELGIDCDLQRTGELDVATEAYQVPHLREEPALAAPYGETYTFLDRDEVRALVDSPTYQGALLDPNVAIVDPARLAWGLRRAVLDLGVRVHERSEVTGLDDVGGGALEARTPFGTVRARRVALATNAFPPLLRRLKHYVVPVYDYVLVSEPLSDAQWASLGWAGRQGVGDVGNQFHYYRPTADGRILWGGYDAVYHRGNGFGPQHEHDPESAGRLATHFFDTFPQVEGLRFTHSWGGAIDTCSRFSAFWGTAYDGRAGYVTGYTGLGVGASRFGAATLLDLLDGRDTERTRLEMVRTKPLPFPPEPVRGWGIDLTRWALDRADRSEGRRNLWLRTLDRLGLGFDS